MVTRLKRLQGVVAGFAIAIAFGAAAATFPYFAPVTGLLKGNANDYHTTLAAGTDVAAVFTGTCDSSTFLGGDGVCRASGAPTGSALTRTNDTNVTLTLGGSPTSALLASTSITAGWSGTLAAARGGTGVGTLGDLTRTNDTNVTLTLGGTPTGALVNSTSMTLGWTGTLAAARGGTGVGSLGNLTKVDDTNVTLTLGGTPTGALITSASVTAGWTGTLAASRGGLGMSTVTDDTVAVANGSGWVSTALTSCSAASSAVTYNTSTNAFGCNTITAGNGTVTVGTFTVTYPIACNTTPTQNWAYIQVSNGSNTTTTVYPTDQVSCTADATGFSNAGGTQIPAGQRPIQEMVFNAGSCANNGTNGVCVIRFGTNGSVTLGNSAFDYNATWTGSGERDFPATNLGFTAYTYRTN